MAVIKACIDAVELALWLLLTTSRPPYGCCRQSASTASVSWPWKPTIITAPISSSSVSPPGPSCANGLGVGAAEGEGEFATPGVGEVADEVEGEPHETSSRASAIAARVRAIRGI